MNNWLLKSTITKYIIGKNIFEQKPRELDSETRHDLLNIRKEGETRMRTFIRQHVIHPPLDAPKKKIRR